MRSESSYSRMAATNHIRKDQDTRSKTPRRHLLLLAPPEPSHLRVQCKEVEAEGHFDKEAWAGDGSNAMMHPGWD